MASDPWGEPANTLTPSEAEEEIIRLKNLLNAKSDEYGPIALEAAEAEARYRVEYAKALLASEYKTVGERESDATVQCERFLFDRRRKEAVEAACKMAERSLERQLDAARSVSSSVRASMESI